MDLSISSVYRSEPDELFVGTSNIKPRRNSGREFADKAPANAILANLSPDVKRLLEPALKSVVLRKEQYIYHQDDELDFVYFPLTAVVSEFMMLEDGRMVEITVTGNEGAVGLSSIMSGLDRALHQTQVSQAGLAKRLDVAQFRRLSRTNVDISASIKCFANQYIRQLSQKAICNMYHSVKERFCTWLLMLQDRSGSSKLSLTHEQIARSLGVYRPSVTCIAQELRDMRLITYSRGGISIISRERVEKSACTCYAELCSA